MARKIASKAVRIARIKIGANYGIAGSMPKVFKGTRTEEIARGPYAGRSTPPKPRRLRPRKRNK